MKGEVIGTTGKNPKIIKYKDKVYIASEDKPLMELKDGKLVKVELK